MPCGSSPLGADHGHGVPVAAGVAGTPTPDNHHDGAANTTTAPELTTTAEPTTAPEPTATSEPTAICDGTGPAATGATATGDRAAVIGPAAGAATTEPGGTPVNPTDQRARTARRTRTPVPDNDHVDQAAAHRGRADDAGAGRVRPRGHGGETPLGPDRADPGDRGRRGRSASGPPPLTGPQPTRGSGRPPSERRTRPEGVFPRLVRRRAASPARPSPSRTVAGSPVVRR
jgi:hypothetical protein